MNQNGGTTAEIARSLCVYNILCFTAPYDTTWKKRNEISFIMKTTSSRGGGILKVM